LRKEKRRYRGLQEYRERSKLGFHGDPKQRDNALRLLAILQAPRPTPDTAGKPDWISGAMTRPGRLLRKP